MANCSYVLLGVSYRVLLYFPLLTKIAILLMKCLKNVGFGGVATPEKMCYDAFTARNIT